VPADRLLYVEVKCGPEILPELKRVLEASGTSPGQIRIISFHFDVVRAVRQELPAYRAYCLSGWKREEETGAWTPAVEELVSSALETGAQGVGVAHDGPLEELAPRLEAAGLEMHVWTVNDAALARHLIDLGARSLTTDRPGWLREQLTEASDSPE
jgi:glycerophosphoryl diester phosphodiesterase